MPYRLAKAFSFHGLTSFYHAALGGLRHASWGGHPDAAGKPMGEGERIRTLQSRIDDLLAGRAQESRVETCREEDRRSFAPFLPSDQHRAGALAAFWMKVADEAHGLDGLEHAVDDMYQSLGRYPAGMVEYAAKRFLTHYAPARQRLVMRSLEERQPGMVQPSGPRTPAQLRIRGA